MAAGMTASHRLCWGLVVPQHLRSIPLWHKGSSGFSRHSDSRATKANPKAAGQSPLQGDFSWASN
jgi:hypothetical protein